MDLEARPDYAPSSFDQRGKESYSTNVNHAASSGSQGGRFDFRSRGTDDVLPTGSYEEIPTFIPPFRSLRHACQLHLQSKLQQLESKINNLPPNSSERASALDAATLLLRAADEDLAHEIQRRKLEDPTFTSGRGISVVHFDVGPESDKAGQWMMISTPGWKESLNIVDREVPRTHLAQIEKFVGARIPSESVYRTRLKHSSERHRGAVITTAQGSVVPRKEVVWFWKAVMVLAGLLLAVFFGTGIIATNTGFKAGFRRGFFWIAVFWTLAQSMLLSWMVKVFGGNKRDMVSAFLGLVGICMVIIQVGQTHLISLGQVQE